MTKYSVLPGAEITFSDHSVAITPLDDGDDRGPEAFLTRTDGTGVSPQLTYGHVKVLHSKRGFVELKNIGWNALDVEVPAPPIGAPKVDT